MNILQNKLCSFNTKVMCEVRVFCSMTNLSVFSDATVPRGWVTATQICI